MPLGSIYIGTYLLSDGLLGLLPFQQSVLDVSDEEHGQYIEGRFMAEDYSNTAYRPLRENT